MGPCNLNETLGRLLRTKVVWGYTRIENLALLASEGEQWADRHKPHRKLAVKRECLEKAYNALMSLTFNLILVQGVGWGCRKKKIQVKRKKVR